MAKLPQQIIFRRRLTRKQAITLCGALMAAAADPRFARDKTFLAEVATELEKMINPTPGVVHKAIQDYDNRLVKTTHRTAYAVRKLK